MGRKTIWNMIVIAGGILAVAVVGVLYFFEPGRDVYFGVCVFHKITGLSCPGCGSTRAVHQLLHGNFLNAIKYNPLIFAVGLIAGYEVLRGVIGVRLPNILSRPGVGWTVVCAILAFWIIRNVLAVVMN